VKRLLLLLAVAYLAGCGGEYGEGKATIWITRDRGTHVLLVRKVPAGLTAMQALDRVADIETRYGGRFVQEIDGIAGSLAARHDWFYFINGYEADRSAAEYRLRRGDVEWWDFRSWQARPRQPVVVGAFPEPFLHGYDGKRRDSYVVVFASTHVREARVVARMLHAHVVDASFVRAVPRGANVLTLRDGRRTRFTASVRAGGGAEFRFVGDLAWFARHPTAFRFRYALP
jgi:hypothetical protein